MLAERNAVPALAVADLDVARAFYEDTLGLTPVETMGDDVVTYRSGGSTFNLYRSRFAGTNQATALTWAVGEELEEVMDALEAKGVTFEHYDIPEMTRQGDVHVAEDFKSAWFKDPDGNILNLVNQ